jgi:anti-sigma regulatory factor (Ser/Thr protein kinase)
MQTGFSHEALLYDGTEGFVEGTLPFIRDAVAAGEPILVMVGAAKIARLRGELGVDADDVEFADMGVVGHNPAWIIPAWREFADAHAGSGRRLRGIGEPIWAGRTAAQLVECQRHEALLNLAFADAQAFRLLCPYDTAALAGDVIDEAHHTHPTLLCDGAPRPSATYRGVDAIAESFAEPLPEPPPDRDEVAIRPGTIALVRRFVAERARRAGLSGDRTADLVLATCELATNSVRHAGGQGVLRMWDEDDALLCEIADPGHIGQPLAGRVRPRTDQVGGHGLWIVNQLCDLVQVRTSSGGNAVRVHMQLR